MRAYNRRQPARDIVPAYDRLALDTDPDRDSRGPRDVGPASARNRSLARALLTAIVAGFLYGGWAVLSNWAHPLAIALRAGAVQFGLSFLSTLTLILLLEALFRLGKTPTHGFWFAVIGTNACVIPLMGSAHWLNGTPNIMTTIAPSVLIGASFFTVYAWRLMVVARSRQTA